LVTAEVDEGRVAAIVEAPCRADTQLGGDVAGRNRPLADRVLGGRRAAAAARVGRRGAIAYRPHRVHAADPEVVVDRRAPTLVERHAEAAQAGVRRDAGGPDRGAGRQRLAGRETGVGGADLLQGRAEADVDAAAAQLAQRVV